MASPGSKQAVEIKADKLTLVGGCDPETYPLQKVRGGQLRPCVMLPDLWRTDGCAWGGGADVVIYDTTVAHWGCI